VSSIVSRRNFVCGLGASWSLGCRCEDQNTRPSALIDHPYFRRVDAHLHVSQSAVARALQIMDREGIRWGVNLSGGPPGGALERHLEQAKAAQGRLLTFTSPDWAECKTAGFGARLAARLEEAAKLGARGLKIHKALGLAVTDPSGRLLAVDDPELDALFAAAGELSLPVWIHTGDPLAFWQEPTPSNERWAELQAHPSWGLFGKPVPTFDELYTQLERRVARHPKTRFVSVHFGNCAEQPDRVAASLRAHPNLCIDTAARIPEMGRHSPARMQAFFEEFQDRVLFGSDLGISSGDKPLFLGSSGATPPTDMEYRRFFDATRRYFETSDRAFEHPTPIQGSWTIDGIGLRTEILEKLYFRNAERLLQRA
jgi:predicted TIM-barrel fold metal-dependent hydrolase